MLESTYLHILYACSALCGVATWTYLRKHEVSGDIASLLLAGGFSLLYFCVQLWAAGGALRLSFNVAAIYATSALTSTVLYRVSPWHPLACYPGPYYTRVTSLWLTFLSYGGRRHLILNRLHDRYGPFVRIGPNILSINSTSAPQIYSAAAKMPKGDSYRAPGHDGVVALFFKQPTEKLHSDRKRIWSGFFTKESLAGITPMLEKRSFQLVQCMERRQKESKDNTVNIADCCYHWSYDLMGDMVFGGSNKLEMMKNGDRRGMIKAGKRATILLDSIGQTPWLLDLVWHLPIGAVMHQLTDVAADLMETRLRVEEPPRFRDLVSYLTEESNVPIRDLKLEAIVAIQGGSDNTSIAITLAIFFLSIQPEYYRLLRGELDRMFHDPSGPLPDDKLLQIPLLEGVINEALRLGSPYFLPRIVPEGGTEIDGRFIPEGTIVAQAAYSQQISPMNFYPEPEAFRPERWIPEGLGPETRANKSALSSFSFGPHACIARQLAYQEMRHVLARVILTLDISPAPSFDPEAFRGGILNMRTTFLEVPFHACVRRRANVAFDGAEE